ncbi:MAG: hypothetical protein INQ03_11780 [Candidatus Heimdallarchaeota archaeon]|nr:hypothetical protein [Candidatus Heimdallarchaeota archaeon]
MSVSLQLIFTALIPLTLSILINTIAFWIILLQYRKRRYQEYLFLIIGLFFSNTLPLSHLIFIFVDGSLSNAVLYRDITGKLAIIFTGVYIIFLYRVMLRFAGKDISTRYNILFTVSFIGLGLFAASPPRWYWDGQNWISIGDVVGTLGAAILGISFIPPMIKITKENLDIAKKKLDIINLRGYKFLYWSSIVSAINLIELVRLRIFHETATVYYVLAYALSSLLISLALIKDPFCLIRRDMDGKFIIIQQIQEGTPRFIYEFELQKTRPNDITIGLTAIKNMLSEVINNVMSQQKSFPEVIEYINLKIAIAEKDEFVIFYVGKKTIEPIRHIIKDILNQFHTLNEAELIEYIEHELRFVF